MVERQYRAAICEACPSRLLSSGRSASCGLHCIDSMHIVRKRYEISWLAGIVYIRSALAFSYSGTLLAELLFSSFVA